MFWEMLLLVAFFINQCREVHIHGGGLARRRLIVPSFRVAVSLECGPGIALLNELSFSSMS